MKYILLSSQRSGSDLLRHSLMTLFDEPSDGPDEWIMHSTTRKNMGLPENLEAARNALLKDPDLLIERMTPGTHRKVMYSHLPDPDYLPKSVPVIHLIRKNTWAQAKSYRVMKQKALPPHVTNAMYIKISSQQISIHLEPRQLELLAQKLLLEKEYWYQSLNKRPDTLALFYEDDISDKDQFMEITLPRIERFLNKKRVTDHFEFPFRKTSSLYTIRNSADFDEQHYTTKYYFDPDSIDMASFYKRRLKKLFKQMLFR